MISPAGHRREKTRRARKRAWLLIAAVELVAMVIGAGVAVAAHDRPSSRPPLAYSVSHCTHYRLGSFPFASVLTTRRDRIARQQTPDVSPPLPETWPAGSGGCDSSVTVL
jgi:hypothetical protein